MRKMKEENKKNGNKDKEYFKNMGGFTKGKSPAMKKE
jgi:hypothetical protein